MFERRIPFFKAMQKAENRKCNMQRETFDKYAIDKLELIHRMELPERDAIQLIIGGIPQSSLRATALSVTAESLEIFLDKIRKITEGVTDYERKNQAAASTPKAKGEPCRNCGRKGHDHKECRNDAVCFNCKQKGHRFYECKKAKDHRPKSASGGASSAAIPSAVSVTEETSPAGSTVAAVEEPGKGLEVVPRL
ncbi:uncharacterized protein LOC113563672 [Ooceraea biroi]|uniref:uncharacterized protein LOC113563672 n=1 Tax=Ooceraea biroi TaxID=2015173 RepID=UPI000F0840DE|nr:uncharacterized protein LOC113563672 [Ooceraea biroi]